MYLPFVSSFLLSPLSACHSLSASFVRLLVAQSSSVFSPSAASPSDDPSTYLLGLGIADITGPVVETNMMGYASLGQTDTGLHMRQRCRAFIVSEASAPENRVLLLNADIGMGDEGVRRELLVKLAKEFGNGTYTGKNVALSGTHQHSGVGGYLENLLPQVTSLGLVPQTFEAIVTGCALAARRAHSSLASGTVSAGNGRVEGGSRNRSPTAYLLNPEEERALYTENGGDNGDQEWNVDVLRFDDENQTADGRGFMSFFGVHGTSIYENNTLVSGDNKGMAAYLYESSVEPKAMPGNNTYVAGFVQSAVGDTSPNTLGAFCESPGKPYDGQPCVANSSTCGGRTEDCHGRGPAFAGRVADPYGLGDLHGFGSNAIIGGIQAKAVKQIFGSQMAQVQGGVRSVHAYLDMSKHRFTLQNGSTVTTCPAAMGFSFAGGTTDGPGAFDFVQGDNKTSQNPFWEIVKVFITPDPSKEQVECQYPKPILLNTGFAHEPYEWSPSIVNIQMFRIGDVVIVVMPGELTTMAGRRMRAAVHSALASHGIPVSRVVISGTSNTYAHYVTTREEYSAQRYEGASTLYGPFTLEAYIDKFTSLVPFLADEPPTASPVSDPPPAEQTSKAISLQNSVKFDAPPFGKHFGQVVQDVNETASYLPGQTVFARFVGANPRNNLRLEETFLSIDKLSKDAAEWDAVRTDSHPTTIFRWTRESTILATSTVNISWTIEDNTDSGVYRIRYFGDSKSIGGTISPFVGYSGNFTIG
ncbi:unnamed protein product [Mycena citricolor]|uniref:Neutral ceramidase n=1 Tax=Mycena citricolor TaxID=2018698 RepID=A0AAD2K0P9_9AGAR|nr:unnamed protein product [Mycena citricolor]